MKDHYPPFSAQRHELRAYWNDHVNVNCDWHDFLLKAQRVADALGKPADASEIENAYKDLYKKQFTL